MKTIALTQGKVALVSDVDYAYLSQWKWFFHQKRYASRARTKKDCPGSHNIFMHQVVAERRGLIGAEIDHRDQNGLNNQRSNLRPATKQQNQRNRGPQANSKSGQKGVTKHKMTGKWQASIRIDGKQTYLGLYSRRVDAVSAYNKAAKKQFGRFAYLNPL